MTCSVLQPKRHPANPLNNPGFGVDERDLQLSRAKLLQAEGNLHRFMA